MSKDLSNSKNSEKYSAINRLSPEEEQGRIRGGQRLLEATFVASGSIGASIENRGTDHQSKTLQISRLIKYARKERLLYRPTDLDFLGMYLANGAEQYVYFKGNVPYVTKFNNLRFHESPLEYFDRLALHNYLFPEAPYELIGFSLSYPTEARFSTVVTQPFVIAQRGAHREEVMQEMEKMGYNYASGDTYYSPDYIIEDLHPGNALITPLGSVAIIDPVIYLNTADEEFGGKRRVNS